MANGHPQYGGTNNVAVLDLGQIDGTRQTNNQATFFAKTTKEGMTERVVEHRMAQNAGVFQDHLGLSSQTIVWEGTIVASTIAVMNAIIDDINEAISGYRRDVFGKLGAFNAGVIKETRLTDFDGTVIADRTRIKIWRPIGPRKFSGNKISQEIRVEFEVLV